jgi:hypothetical protein
VRLTSAAAAAPGSEARELQSVVVSIQDVWQSRQLLRLTLFAKSPGPIGAFESPRRCLIG